MWSHHTELKLNHGYNTWLDKRMFLDARFKNNKLKPLPTVLSLVQCLKRYCLRPYWLLGCSCAGVQVWVAVSDCKRTYLIFHLCDIFTVILHSIYINVRQLQWVCLSFHLPGVQLASSSPLEQSLSPSQTHPWLMHCPSLHVKPPHGADIKTQTQCLVLVRQKIVSRSSNSK